MLLNMIKRLFTYYLFLLLLAALAGLVAGLPAVVLAQNGSDDFTPAGNIDVDTRVAFVSLISFRTSLSGSEIVSDDDLLNPDDRIRIERSRALIGDDFTGRVRDGYDDLLYARSIRFSKTENMDINITIEDGFAFDNNLFEIGRVETQALWLNDGSLNPGMAFPLRRGVQNEVPMFNQPLLIRDFEEWQRNLSAYMILETRIRDFRNLNPEFLDFYTVSVRVDEYE